MPNPKVFESAFNVYSVTNIIGEGGSGRVFAVRDTDGEEFALKCLFPDRVTAEKRKRFKNEIGFCSKVQHANIIRVYDSGLVDWDKRKSPFYVMPRFPTTLRNLIDQKLALADILPLFSQILDGVEAAHLLRVFHRDLKPENILCDATKKSVVVADFGIAHFEEDLIATAIETPAVAKMANLAYSAPEQRAKGLSVDHRADIFALGLILNEMFTGTVPQGAGFTKIETIASDFEYLDAIVEKMIQHRAEVRPANIDEIKRDLIGHQNAFVARQELDRRKAEVIATSKVGPVEDVGLIDVDWRDGNLVFRFNQVPSQDWVQCFQYPRGGYSSLYGAEPVRFIFRERTASIPAEERNVNEIVKYVKTYVEMANQCFRQTLEAAAKRTEMESRQKLEQETKAAETRARILKNLQL